MTDLLPDSGNDSVQSV